MPIKRAHRTSNFAQIPNETLRDQNLTNSTYRLLMYMLSMTDDWIFRNSKIAKDFDKSERWVRKSLTELERAGYIKRKAIKNDGGQIEYWERIIYDSPEAQNMYPGKR